MHDSVFIGLLSGAEVDFDPAPDLPLVNYPPILHIPGFTAQPPNPPPDSPPPASGDIRAAIEKYFAPQDWDCASCIQRHEWGGVGTDHNPGYILEDGTRSEDSWGWWQINFLAHFNITVEMARDVDWSTRYAAGLYYGAGSWRDWANSGRACHCY